MINSSFQASGLNKEDGNGIISYEFKLDCSYIYNGFPAILVTQNDENGFIKFNICQVDYLICLYEALLFFERNSILEDCDAFVEGSGLFFKQPNLELPNKCNFSVNLVNEKITDHTMSTPYFCELFLSNIFDNVRIYGVTRFEAFKNSIQILCSLIHI